MNTKMKISMDCDNVIAKVIQDYIKKQQSHIDFYKSSNIKNEQEIKELRAKKPDDFKPSIMFSRKALELHNLNKLNTLCVNMESSKKDIEKFKAKIRDNENLLAMLIEYDFNFTTILQNKLMTLKELLKLVVNSIFYVLQHCGESPVCEYQSVIDLIVVIMCELNVNKSIAVNESYLQENYNRCLEMEKKNIDTSLIYGKKTGDLFFPPNVYDVPMEIGRLNNEITNSCGDMSDTSLGRQLYIWLYIAMQMISKKTL